MVSGNTFRMKKEMNIFLIWIIDPSEKNDLKDKQKDVFEN